MFVALTTQVHLYNQVRGFAGSTVVKNPPANAGDAGHVGSNPGLGRFTLEEEMATHFSILAWDIPWTDSLQPRGYSPRGHRVGQDLAQLSMREHNQVWQVAYERAVGCGHVDGAT